MNDDFYKEEFFYSQKMEVLQKFISIVLTIWIAMEMIIISLLS